MINTIFAGPMIGELGWSVSRWHAYCRYLKLQKYPKQKFIVADYDWRYPLYEYADMFIPLPGWFLDLKLEQDCYEAVPPDAGAGSLTPSDVYHRLLEHFKQYYDVNTTKEIRTPRGCNFVIQQYKTQMWTELEPSPEMGNLADSLLYKGRVDPSMDAILISARGRSRAADRNIPEETWETLVDRLRDHFIVVIIGTPSTSLLSHKIGRNIVNVINILGRRSLDLHIALMKRSIMSVSSQSGPSLISLLAGCPAYIIGHEKIRHSVAENWLETPCLFREVPHGIYAAIDVETMLGDIYKMYNALKEKEKAVEKVTNYCLSESVNILDKIITENVGIRLLQMDVNEIQKAIKDSA